MDRQRLRMRLLCNGASTLPREWWEAVIRAAGEERNQPLLAARDAAIVGVFLFAGVRCGELCALDVEDVDLDHDRLRVCGFRGREARWVRIAGQGADVLEAWLDVRPEYELCEAGRPCQPLFVSRKGGRLSTSGVRRLLGCLERKVWDGMLGGDAPTVREVPSVHPQALRRAHARELITWARRRGRPAEEVAAQVGHLDPRNPFRYYGR